MKIAWQAFAITALCYGIARDCNIESLIKTQMTRQKPRTV